jgi:hypothetical protein
MRHPRTMADPHGLRSTAGNFNRLRENDRVWKSYGKVFPTLRSWKACSGTAPASLERDFAKKCRGIVQGRWDCISPAFNLSPQERVHRVILARLRFPHVSGWDREGNASAEVGVKKISLVNPAPAGGSSQCRLSPPADVPQPHHAKASGDQ